MGLLVSFFFGFFPMLLFAAFVYWMDHFEKEPKILLGAVFTWGVIVAAGGAFILNTLFGVSIYLLTGSEGASNVGTAVLSAPFIEESLKGLAVLFVFLFFKKEFDSVLDGIIYAAIAALGFAATENFLYIYEKGYLVDGWSGLWFMVFIRVLIVGWQHPFYTAFLGIGLSISRLSPNTIVKWVAPIAGWIASVITHSIHNLIASIGIPVLCIAGSILDWSGWFALFVFVLFMVLREKKWATRYLAEEIQLGIISETQYHTARSVLKRMTLPLRALVAGKYNTSTRFYQLCGELTHKKNQYALHGDENGNRKIIQSIREELKKLSPAVIA